ncbi:MAG: DUF4194 domain-containing protein [Rhodoferax sp.]|nr:DUF4194 domain-containing protein [Rhodoferax sp.]
MQDFEATLEPSAESATLAPQYDLTSLVVPLLKGVLYREEDAPQWNALLQLQARVRDYVSVLALNLVLDEAEGYAFLRSKGRGDGLDNSQDDDNAPKLPRLVRRQPLSFQVSLLLALLRKKLAEFDANGGDTRLILSRDAVVELVRVFLPAGSNESRLIDQVDTQLNKVIELGFVRRLKVEGVGTARKGAESMYEVRRILKAFVDAQWLAEFDERLLGYQAQLSKSLDAVEDGDA